MASADWETITQLHEYGVVWCGDTKPDKVLIHNATSNCWLVNFGADWTDA